MERMVSPPIFTKAEGMNSLGLHLRCAAAAILPAPYTLAARISSLRQNNRYPELPLPPSPSTAAAATV